MVDHSRSGTSLWRIVAPEVCPVNVISRLRGHWCHHLPVDVLGLFSCILSDRGPFHWRSGQLWHEERGSCTVAWVIIPAGDRVLLLPAAVLYLHSHDRGWWDIRERQDPSIVGVWLVLGNHCVSHLAVRRANLAMADSLQILPDRMLDLEC